MINELLPYTLAASRQLVTLDDATINRILELLASGFADTPSRVLAANVRTFVAYGPGKSNTTA